MNKRTPIVISTISNAFCDFGLDIAVNKYNMYKILLGTSIGAAILQLIYGISLGIKFTLSSLPFIFLCGLITLFGYLFYVYSLKKLPIVLISIIERGNIFFFLIIDMYLGYMKVTPYFILLFLIFILSVFMFSSESYKLKNRVKYKKVKLSGILIIFASMLLYLLEPYMIRLASSHGANEVAINLGYYLITIPYFTYMYKTNKKESNGNGKKKNIWTYILLISLFESIYYIFGTMGYIEEAPIINIIIQELRVFILVILSVITHSDKLTPKKVIALIIGILAIVGIYLY
jgi:drug/metabolite transporter (DMT)-like permease